MTMTDTALIRAGQAVTSCAQDGLWLLDRVGTQTGAHRIARRFDASGYLDLESLAAAWDAVLERHEVLRSTLVEVDGRPVQQIGKAAVESFVVTDLRHLARPDRDEQADRLCAELAAEPMDLAGGPLARLTVLRLDTAEQRLVLVAHRAVADERSLSIILAQLSADYAEAVALSSVTVQPASLQYADYARWRRDADADRPVRRDWWSTALTSSPSALTADRPRSSRPVTGGCGTLRFDWGTDAADLLTDLCDDSGATPLAVLLAGYQGLLQRFAGEDRVAIGVAYPVRPQAFAEVVGPFDNLLVISGDLSDGPTFRELVGRAEESLREAFDNRALPFTHLVRALNGDGDPRQGALCDAMLIVATEPEAELRLTGAAVTRAELRTGTAAADLTLTVERFTASIAGSLAFRDDHFGPDAAEVLLDQLGTLLIAALAAPDTRVGDLPLDGVERSRALELASNQIGVGAAAEEPVHELFRRIAQVTPDAVAVSWHDGELTYGELDRRAALLAGHLAALGARGKAVAIRLTPGPSQLAASLGVLRAGAHMVWFGTGDAGERGRVVLDELRPACLLREGDPAGDELARWFGEELGGRVIDLATLDAVPVPPPTEPVSLEELAYVAYTSGSTGKPKGIAQTHGAFTQFVAWLADSLDVGPGTRIAQWAAPEHDPSLCEVFAALTTGATLCPVPEKIRAHPEKFVDWLVESRITFLQTVPSFGRELLKVFKRRDPAARTDSLRRLVLMGEALPPELVNGFRAALPGIALANVYGPTETIAATWHEVTGDVAATVPIGRSIPGRQVLVLDEADRPCPVGVTGEIVIRSPFVARGYIGDESGGGAFRPVDGGSSGRIENDPERMRCYRTGDLARRRADGLLEFRGRRDLQVKLYGTRVELADVEAALAEHDSVAECAVVPLTDSDGLVIQLVAFVVPRRTPSGADAAGADAWRTHLRKRFGTSMLLVSFQTSSSSLPRNVGGKVDRRRLAAGARDSTTARRN
ncbi:amino acid adenylation domain-containing protein [Allocatelliglobosispora scoriae]|uniref:Amino acid adenylation domain-containing protein n=1 Tax=Allocatelliglobosispora scoriae TaxID=643052 RepID=A0A841BTF6_9ACTN|nr:amino acid adenylation domain-containing protein [Allocatelliglobosispora scoriae]MBB5870071.1 amino acid adenylation domain-containing protein [Allocatelliglobosispora scoriae]